MVQTTNINIDDAVLVEKCQQGDQDAMETLIIRYQNRIYNVILKICANTDDAAELTQETFVKALENINKFKGKSSFYTWTFRIAVNTTINYCKKNVKLGIHSLDAEIESKDGQAKAMLKQILIDDNCPDPADIAQSKELTGLIIKAMTRLDDNHRTIIVLRDIEDMNYDNIAEVLNIELGTVKSRLSRARSNLREIMEGFIK